MNENGLNYIDLFAGAGGLSEGFIQSGYRPVAHVEMNGYAAKTLETRIAYYYLKDNGELNSYYDYEKGKITRTQLLEKIPEEELKTVINKEMSESTIKGIFNTIDEIKKEKGIEKIDVIIGGPPCQAYSLVGRAQSSHMVVPMEDDPRNELYKMYVQFLNKYKPRMFVFENVAGIKSARGGQAFKNLQMYMKRVGYEICYDELNAHDFGVLQSRKRVIIVGWLKGTGYDYPSFEVIHSNAEVWDLLKDLPALNPGDEAREHTMKDMSRLKDYVKENNIRIKSDVLTGHIARPHTAQDIEIYRKYIKSEGRRELVDEFESASNGLPVKIYKHTGYEIGDISLKNFEARESEIRAQYYQFFDTIYRTYVVQQENEFQNALMSRMEKNSLYSVEYVPSRGRNEGKQTTLFYHNGELCAWLKDTAFLEKKDVVKTTKLSNVWKNDDIPKADLGNEGGVAFPRSKKPEKLIERILLMATNEGDLVLDSFLGSGTTAAVAHKMRRRYIGIELGDHCYTHCKKRLDRVIDGKDRGGVTNTYDWQGGGGYKFYELAEPLLVKNKVLPVYQINPSYTWDMVCEAICKIEGFTYEPSGEFQGHSSENRFIHIDNHLEQVKPIVLIACKDTTHARKIKEKIDSDAFFGGRYVGKAALSGERSSDCGHLYKSFS